MNIKKNKIFLDSYFSKMHKTLSLDKNLHDNIVKTKVLFEKCSKRKGRVVFLVMEDQQPLHHIYL